MYVLTADYQNKNAPDIFVESLKKTGFGVLKNHPIDTQLVKDVFVEWENFFASEDKFQYQYDKQNQDGYFPLKTSETAKGYNVKDLKEFYHLYPWGRYPKNLSSKTRELYNQMSQLAATLLEWVELKTPEEIRSQFSMPLADMIKDSPKTMLRILHYPPLTGSEEEGAVRAAAHEDIDLLTILPTATATGLEVKDKEGNWHSVESDSGTLVINAGDMLQLCSNFYYQSTTHRVINPVGEEAKKSRFSMPLFLHPRDEVVLSSKHTAKSYLWERLVELGVV